MSVPSSSTSRPVHHIPARYIQQHAKENVPLGPSTSSQFPIESSHSTKPVPLKPSNAVNSATFSTFQDNNSQPAYYYADASSSQMVEPIINTGADYYYYQLPHAPADNFWQPAGEQSFLPSANDATRGSYPQPIEPWAQHEEYYSGLQQIPAHQPQPQLYSEEHQSVAPEPCLQQPWSVEQEQTPVEEDRSQSAADSSQMGAPYYSPQFASAPEPIAYHFEFGVGQDGHPQAPPPPPQQQQQQQYNHDVVNMNSPQHPQSILAWQVPQLAEVAPTASPLRTPPKAKKTTAKKPRVSTPRPHPAPKPKPAPNSKPAPRPKATPKPTPILKNSIIFGPLDPNGAPFPLALVDCSFHNANVVNPTECAFFSSTEGLQGTVKHVLEFCWEGYPSLWERVEIEDDGSLTKEDVACFIASKLQCMNVAALILEVQGTPPDYGGIVPPPGLEVGDFLSLYLTDLQQGPDGVWYPMLRIGPKVSFPPILTPTPPISSFEEIYQA